MSQELRGGNTGGFATGSNCPKTGLYKSTDGKIEFIEYIEQNSAFPAFPGGSGTKKCTWYRLSQATDGARSDFNAVKVAPGTL